MQVMRRTKSGLGVARKVFRIGAPAKDIDAIANIKVLARIHPRLGVSVR